ncbi:MBL fold metallo-hydrolase [bacterium]|nr:MBL fold metallo-hydrolase [bacterium]MBU1675981.1 MBL fold metallo-hydrolase [bacterium]
MPLPGLEHTDWELRCLTVGPLLMNAYLLSSPAAGVAALVDPGDDPDVLLAAVEASACRLSYLLCTHCHFDHISAAAMIQAEWDLPLLVHPHDRALIENLNGARAMYGFLPVATPRWELLPAGAGGKLPFAGGDLRWLQSPGHSPGHLIFHFGDSALVGDVIFAGSIGRTDLPGGDFDTLARSIRTLVYTMDEKTVLHTGHGPATTVGEEMASNPFVRLD